MKNCELCKGLARTYCESDQASLCWTCDVKVHGANFLVARHTRSVLCHACQAPTPWKASGAELGVTVSVCENCVAGVRHRGGEEESQGGNDDQIDTEDDDDDDLNGDDDDDDDDVDGGDEEEEEEEEEEVVGGGDDDDEEDADNQVVPWSSSASTPPPPSASSSSSEESISRFNNGGGEASEIATVLSLKRMRETDLLPSQEDLGRSFPQRKNSSGTDGKATTLYTSPLKDRRTDTDRPGQGGQTGLRAPTVVESLKRFHRQDNTKLSEESGAIDLNSPASPSRPI